MKQGRLFKVLSEEKGDIKLGKNQYVDGKGGYTKCNPIAFNKKIGGRVKVILPKTHALYNPVANSKKA